MPPAAPLTPSHQQLTEARDLLKGRRLASLCREPSPSDSSRPRRNVMGICRRSAQELSARRPKQITPRNNQHHSSLRVAPFAAPHGADSSLGGGQPNLGVKHFVTFSTSDVANYLEVYHVLPRMDVQSLASTTTIPSYPHSSTNVQLDSSGNQKTPWNPINDQPRSTHLATEPATTRTHGCGSAAPSTMATAVPPATACCTSPSPSFRTLPRAIHTTPVENERRNSEQALELEAKDRYERATWRMYHLIITHRAKQPSWINPSSSLIQITASYAHSQQLNYPLAFHTGSPNKMIFTNMASQQSIDNSIPYQDDEMVFAIDI